MALTTGARIGPYEVLSPLGSGGMGEVYLAHDRRLSRDVAIKALRGESVSGDVTDQLFREARAAAALVDPHIAAIHDVIESDGRPMIVMEYVPGRSLDHVLLTNGRAWTKRSTGPSRLPRHSPPRMHGTSSTATSSRPTSASPPTATSRSWTSVSPAFAR